MPETVTGEGRALADRLERIIAGARRETGSERISTRYAAHIGWTIADHLPTILAALRERGSVSLDREGCGAEAMREACAKLCDEEAHDQHNLAVGEIMSDPEGSATAYGAQEAAETLATRIRALPISRGEL